MRFGNQALGPERQILCSYNPTYGATLSMPSVVGRAGVLEILEPSMSEDERHALERSADRCEPRPLSLKRRPKGLPADYRLGWDFKFPAAR